MKLSVALSAIATIAIVAAAPTTENSPSYSKVAAEIPDNLPPIQGLSSFVQKGESQAKRDIEKRDSLTVEVWADPNKAGRHESMHIQTNNCYQLWNGWEDQISSAEVPKGFGCLFYRHPGCKNNEDRLTVYGYLSDFQFYGFNDAVSSYLCWK